MFVVFALVALAAFVPAVRWRARQYQAFVPNVVLPVVDLDTVTAADTHRPEVKAALAALTDDELVEWWERPVRAA